MNEIYLLLFIKRCLLNVLDIVYIIINFLSLFFVIGIKLLLLFSVINIFGIYID